jgi:hypothetical protein
MIVSQDTAGHACPVTLAEIRYTLARKHDRPTADEYLDWLSDLGIEPVDVGDAWVEASEYVLTYNPALGDALALAAATRRSVPPSGSFSSRRRSWTCLRTALRVPPTKIQCWKRSPDEN